MTTPRLAGLLSAALLGLAVGVAHAQDKKLVLRVADSFPPGHAIPDYATKWWMDAVTKATQGAVEFEYYPAEQLGKAKDLLALTQSGVADIAYVGPSYVSDKMPLSAVSQLPGMFTSACVGTSAYWKLAKDGVLRTQEFATNGIRPLFAFVAPPYQVFTTKRRPDVLKNMEGMKLRTTGGAMDLMARKLKAVPVQMAPPDMMESLTRGTIDGGVLAVTSVIAYDFTRAVRYATIGENFGSFVGTYSISEAKWQKLPANVQKAMLELGEQAVQRTCQLMDKNEETLFEKARQAGVSLLRLPEAEHKELAHLFDSLAKEWAEGLDRRGKPGTETLKAYRAAMNERR
ncbi:MAG: hypothetical protein AMXMBFR6_22220 [Betaproteobacteria bacterium]|nr:TRAP transporter substrate-binding protein DctP [Rhodocyclaceae bacterium]